MGALSAGAYFVGVIVSMYVFLARADLLRIDREEGIHRGQFLLANPWFFFLVLIKSFLWPAVFVLWVITGFSGSPWRAIAEHNGREVRQIVRVSGRRR